MQDYLFKVLKILTLECYVSLKSIMLLSNKKRLSQVETTSSYYKKQHTLLGMLLIIHSKYFYFSLLCSCVEQLHLDEYRTVTFSSSK